MATFERVSSGAKRVGRTSVGRSALLLALALSSTACDKIAGLDGWSSPAVSNSPDFSLSVDCVANPKDSQRLRLIQTSAVQIVKLSVRGSAGEDQWRFQVLPPDSDLTVSQPDGSGPTSTIYPKRLRTGRPQQVNLPQGSLTVRQTADRAIPSPTPPGTSPPETPVEGGPQLELSLDCQAPPGHTPGAIPH